MCQQGSFQGGGGGGGGGGEWEGGRGRGRGKRLSASLLFLLSEILSVNSLASVERRPLI